MKGKWSLLLLLLLGLGLLLIGGLGGGREATDDVADTEAYRARLTAEVETLLAAVRGVGEVRVLLTLEAGESRVYAEGATGGTLTAGGEAILVESRPPRVLGVAVVCTGGGDPAVREEITALLASSLGIGTHKVKVSAKK